MSEPVKDVHSQMIACLSVPRFSLNALERTFRYGESDSLIGLVRELPVEATKRLEVVSLELESLGVFAGMTVAHARALVPDISVRARDSSCEESGLDALRDLVFSCSPNVEIGRGSELGLIWFDLSGLHLLYPKLEDLKTYVELGARRLGFDAVLGISKSKLWSKLATNLALSGGHTGIVVNDSAEQRLLELSLSLLSLPTKLRHSLERLGVRTIRDLLKIPRAELLRRFNREEGLSIKRAVGHAELLKCERERERFIETLHLDEPIWDLNMLMYCASEVIERLSSRLELRGHYAQSLRIDLDYDGKGAYQTLIELSTPSRNTRLWREVVLLRLESNRPDAPVQSLVLECITAPRSKEQLDFFTKSVSVTENLNLLVTKLERHCAPNGVGRMQSGNSYVQDDAFQVPISHKIIEYGRRTPEWISGTPRILRRIRPPEPVEVDWDEGLPCFVKGEGFIGRVREVYGPFRQCGEWWRHDVEVGEESETLEERGFYWDLYDLELTDGHCLRLLHRIRGARSFVVGIYD